MRKSLIGYGLALAAMGSTLTQMVRPRPLADTKKHVDELIGLAANIFDGKTEGDKKAIIDAEAKRQRKQEKRARIAKLYGITPEALAALPPEGPLDTEMPPPNPVAEAVYGKPNVKASIGPTRKIDRSEEAMALKVQRDKITKQAKRDWSQGDEPRYYQNAAEQAMYDKAWARIKEKANA